jgi:hypothetical protein
LSSDSTNDGQSTQQTSKTFSIMLKFISEALIGGVNNKEIWEISPKTITLLLCILMDNHQTCSTPIRLPKWKKVLHPMTSPINSNPVTSPKKKYHPKTSSW